MSAALEQWTIFRSPPDYPGKYVLRRTVITAGRITPDPKPRSIEKDLETARGCIPWGCVCLTRIDEDDPSVVETWV